MEKQLSPEELTAQGLVSVLKLEPDKHYILFLNREAFSGHKSPARICYLLAEMGMKGIGVEFADDFSAQDVVKAVEVS